MRISRSGSIDVTVRAGDAAGGGSGYQQARLKRTQEELREVQQLRRLLVMNDGARRPATLLDQRGVPLDARASDST